MPRGLNSLGKVGKECEAFGFEADFFCSTVFLAFSRDRSKLFNECDVFGSVHDVGNSVLRCVDEFGCDFFGKVGNQVRSLADGGAGGFDLIVEAISTEVVGDVVGFFGLSREGEANPLFGVLSVVFVLSGEVVGKVEVSHFCCSFLWEFLSLSDTIIA